MSNNMDTKARYNEFTTREGWFVKTFHVRLFTLSSQMYGVGRMMRRFDWGMQSAIGLAVPDNTLTYVWNKIEMSETRAEFLRRVHDGDFFERFESDFFDAWENFVAEEKLFLSKRESFTIDEHYTRAMALVETESVVAEIGYLNDCFLSFGGEDWLAPLLLREIPETVDDRNELVLALVAPNDFSYVQEEERALLAVASHPMERWPQLLQEHSDAWHWIDYSYFESPRQTIDQLQQRLEEMRGDGDPQKVLDVQERLRLDRQTRKAAIMDEHKFSKEGRRVVDFSSRLSHLTDVRKQGAMRLSAVLFVLLRHMEQELDVPYDRLAWLVQMDGATTISDIPWDRLEERQRNGVIQLYSNGEYGEIPGTEFPNIDMGVFHEKSKSGALKGQVAFAGEVTGTVRIVQSRTEFAHFEDGDILVTNQTTPEFVSLMKRAGAVVTEQGGITCHAAILSRELKKPCVIGVEHVTNVLENGMTVVVDAHKGEVTIIE